VVISTLAIEVAESISPGESVSPDVIYSYAVCLFKVFGSMLSRHRERWTSGSTRETSWSNDGKTLWGVLAGLTVCKMVKPAVLVFYNSICCGERLRGA
jgi:hypothetical protein